MVSEGMVSMVVTLERKAKEGLAEELMSKLREAHIMSQANTSLGDLLDDCMHALCTIFKFIFTFQMCYTDELFLDVAMI